MYTTTRILVIFIGLVLTACQPVRQPVDKLSFKELESVTNTCKRTGKIATDDYCKEAAVVYSHEYLRHREQDRLAKVFADDGPTHANMTPKK